MSSSPSPPTLTADPLIVIVASVSCLLFLIVVLLLLTVLLRKDPLCCRASSGSQQHYTDTPPQHHNSRQSLVGYSYDTQSTLASQLPGRLFIVGKPDSYHLDGPAPRLPSYESVRKKDRQRQIHSMIAQRFGLGGCSAVSSEQPPPSYEETLSRSIDDVSPLDLPTSSNSYPSSTQTPRGAHLRQQDTDLSRRGSPEAQEGLASSRGPVESTGQRPPRPCNRLSRGRQTSALLPNQKLEMKESLQLSQ